MPHDGEGGGREKDESRGGMGECVHRGGWTKEAQRQPRLPKTTLSSLLQQRSEWFSGLITRANQLGNIQCSCRVGGGVAALAARWRAGKDGGDSGALLLSGEVGRCGARSAPLPVGWWRGKGGHSATQVLINNPRGSIGRIVSVAPGGAGGACATPHGRRKEWGQREYNNFTGLMST